VQSVILFGARSPLLPDYEETCARSNLAIAAIIRVDQLRTRALHRDLVLDLGALGAGRPTAPFIACAFSPTRRAELVALAMAAALRPAAALIDPSAVVAASTRIGQGGYVNAGVVIGAAGLIGDHAIVNRASSIGHHAFIGDLVSIGPGVTIAGGVRLGSRSFVGAGSVLLPGIQVGEEAVIAAGAVVKHDVAPGMCVAGNPARARQRRPGAALFGKE
jgi:sugar O-acyltransferase (sialic acid O-acetyltransferase NeuD family)